jgi:NADPH:quinone reductase
MSASSPPSAMAALSSGHGEMQARAAFYERSGPAKDVFVLGTLPVRPPGPGEVLVRLSWSGINPTDVKNRGGAPGRAIAFDRVVPHHDGAGIVEATGGDASDELVGQPVWVFCGQNGRAFGTASQYITIDRRFVAPLPARVPLEIGACLGVPAMTAWNAVLGDGHVAGQIVLVAGAAGSVGHYAVQIAKSHGARVLATISSDAKAEEARQAGADQTFNYTLPGVADAILGATGGHGVDLFVDVNTTANAELAAKVMTLGGRIASYGSQDLSAVVPVRDLRQRCVSVRFLTIHRFGPETLQPIAAGINAMLEVGTLRHRIAQRFPLERIVEAHEAVESGKTVGKVLVEID